MASNEASLILYRHPLSGHCHRAELLLSLAALPHELVNVDVTAGAQKRPEFLAKNPFGQVPVLVHGEFVLPESNAILVYLAERFPSAARYLPPDAEQRGLIQRWLSIATGPLAHGPAAARLVRVFGRKLDHPQAVSTAESLLRVLEQELSARHFLVGSTLTLADIALYAYTARAPEGDVLLDAYPAVRAWLGRIEAMPRFVPMQAAPARS
jgi:glutathione S-transferase